MEWAVPIFDFERESALCIDIKSGEGVILVCLPHLLLRQAGQHDRKIGARYLNRGCPTRLEENK